MYGWLTDVACSILLEIARCINNINLNVMVEVMLLKQNRLFVFSLNLYLAFTNVHEVDFSYSNTPNKMRTSITLNKSAQHGWIK